MKRAVGIADLKAHLSEHLRAVKKGRTLTAMDRDTPSSYGGECEVCPTCGLLRP